MAHVAPETPRAAIKPVSEITRMMIVPAALLDELRADEITLVARDLQADPGNAAHRSERCIVSAAPSTTATSAGAITGHSETWVSSEPAFDPLGPASSTQATEVTRREGPYDDDLPTQRITPLRPSSPSLDAAVDAEARTYSQVAETLPPPSLVATASSPCLAITRPDVAPAPLTTSTPSATTAMTAMGTMTMAMNVATLAASTRALSPAKPRLAYVVAMTLVGFVFSLSLLCVADGARVRIATGVRWLGTKVSSL